MKYWNWKGNKKEREKRIKIKSAYGTQRKSYCDKTES